LLLANGNPANVTVEIVTQACPDASTDTACLRNPAVANATLRKARVTPNASGFSYAPPLNFSTHDTGGTAHFDAPSGRFLEQIRYRLRRTDNVNDFSAVAVVQIPVKALTTFATAAGTWNAAPCNSCHLSGSNPPPPYLTSGSYASLHDGNLTNLARAKVDVENPDSSGLICYPEHLCAVGSHDIVATDDDLATVREWIQSGANNY
jgi:hypothetical protein